jgi:hypothetical protein
VILGSAPECVADAAETTRVTLVRALLDRGSPAKTDASSAAGARAAEDEEEDKEAADVPDAAIKGDSTLGLVGASPSAAAAASGPWLGSQLSRDGADHLLHSLSCLCFVEAENRSLPSMDAWAAQVRDDASLAVCVALALSASLPAPSPAVSGSGAGHHPSSTLRKRRTATKKEASEGEGPTHPESSWAEPIRAACRANRKQLEQCASVLGLQARHAVLASPRALLDHLSSLRTSGRGRGTSLAVPASQLGLPVIPPALPVLACMPLRAATATDRNVAARWVFGRVAYRINTVTATVFAIALLFWASGAAAALDMYVLGSASLARRAVLSGCQVLAPDMLEPACGGLSVAVFSAWMLLLSAGFAAGGSLACGPWLGALVSSVPHDAHHAAAVAALEAVVATRPTRLLPARAGTASPARPPSLRMVMPPYGANVAALAAPGGSDKAYDEDS